MTAVHLLPELLTLQNGEAETIVGLNAAMRAGTLTLDWSAVREAEPAAVEILLDGLSLTDDAEVYGAETVPEPLQEMVARVLEAGERRRKRTARPRRAPRQTSDAPAVYVAPRPAVVPEALIAAETEPSATEPPGEGESPIFPPPSPRAIRDEIARLVRADLLGPQGGDTEELTDDPRERYLVGTLAPRGVARKAEEDEPLAQGGADTGEDGTTDAPLAMQTLFPSSIGLTVCIAPDATMLTITPSWGRYMRTNSETRENPKTGGPLRVWRREQMGGEPFTVPLEDGKLLLFAPDAETPGVRVRYKAQRIPDPVGGGELWFVTVWLANEQRERTKERAIAWLFQPKLRLTAPDGAAIFRRRPFLRPIAGTDATVGEREDAATAMRHRMYREFAAGHGVGVAVEAADAPGCAAAIHTEVLPDQEVPAATETTPHDIAGLDGLPLDMKTLAAIPNGAFGTTLAPLVTAYQAWIAAREAQISDPEAELGAFAAAAHTTLVDCRTACERIAAGIALLDRSADAAMAFRFANEAMWQQRVHTVVAEQRRGGGDTSGADVPENRSWRLFQLAFVLLNLPSLTDPLHPERADTPDAGADLLWFPTGGGKTEAYLGLTAYTLAIRRLQGTVAGRSGLDGVAVIMRYTLRLLTVQQFQRAAALLCACDEIRRADVTQWGATPFRLGMWVGRNTTPNRTDDAAEVIQQLRRGNNASGRTGTPEQLRSCPWCGAAIQPATHLKVDKDRKRTLIYCGDPHGDCPFTEAKRPGEGLPVVVVDEEIYRLLPALLIATVDKFAQMPWQGATRHLFGRVEAKCSRHGFCHVEYKEAHPHSHRCTPSLPSAVTQPHGPLRPPDLIVQDELHLISGPLGTLVGLYETVVDRLCAWEVEGQIVRPKVIASTATVRRAGEQMHRLFLRRVAIFPPPGLDAGDTFFARERPVTEATPGRRYLGVCAPGKRQKVVLIRVYVAHLAAAQLLFERYGTHADPWMTLVGYFNAMRELAGMRRLVEDDITTRLRKADELGLASRRAPMLEELTSRRGARDLPDILARLERRFVPSQEGAKRAGERPLDVLLATNMISVGVDVRRLGLMIVAGQPKTTAEYIQATSRVGRQQRSPGLVCTVFNWARPRDLSHYEQFGHYHATFYGQVEALSVTPFSARALDRGLTGVLVGYLRLLSDGLNTNDDAGKIAWDNPYIARAVADIAARAGIVTTPEMVAEVRTQLDERVRQWIEAAGRPMSGAVLRYSPRPRNALTVPLLRAPDDGPWQEFTCLNSLRDVEPEVRLRLEEAEMGQDEHRPFVSVATKDEATDDDDSDDIAYAVR